MGNRIRKFRNWHIDIYKHRIRITDGWHSDWPIFYSETEVAFDNPYRLPKPVLNYVSRNSKSLYNIQQQLRGA
jgi:hypothetical protein